MSTRIRVATYNVNKCQGLDRRVRPERIAEVIAELDADVVAIQEILDVRNGETEWDQARRVQEEFNKYQCCYRENRPLRGGRYGNMTLSRFPVRRCENYHVTWRRREKRGCLRTDVEIAKDELLHIFNVHLGTGFVERRHQARRLLSEEVLNRQECCGPRIVVGDFNEWTGISYAIDGRGV